ncbi:MAG: AraC family transcriptional regulator of adaptative response [Francisellaceae bacterium]|jgi:AraC family transcriptional regulator of adaptative response/methylated-DNA-[protein]-cysteine methyltransferase
MCNNVFWKAIIEQDSSFDFQFYYGVKTTKSFCNPSCKNKAPPRKDIVYFDNITVAYNDGYQACKSCKPNCNAKQESGLLRLLHVCCKIEEHTEGSLTALQLASSVGLTQYQLHRLFKKYLNVTPKSYIDQIQLNTLKANLRRTGSVTDAIFESGIESTSVIYGRMNSHLGMTPKKYREGGEGIQISYAVGTTSLGLVLIAATNKGLSFLQFGDNKHQLLAQLVSEYPRAEIELMSSKNEEQLSNWLKLLNLYIDGTTIALDIPLDIRGTVFQKKVWDFLRSIPYGKVMSYGEIANAIGSPKAYRAVANACAGNNIALVIPCHRVIRGDGAIGGYRWGEERKRAIIDLERTNDATAT